MEEINVYEQRADKALRHLEEMNKRYEDAIKKSIKETSIHYGCVQTSYDEQYDTAVIFEQTDTVSAVLGCIKADGHLGVLNFANYTTPGGGFIGGAMAQEEAICHESTLYNVISEITEFYDRNKNSLHTVGALYSNAAMINPDIVFERDYETKLCDVITCAAPNAMSYLAAGGSQKLNATALLDRIDFILSIAAQAEIETLILGAFGCGVFGQNPYTLGSIYRHLLSTKYKGVFKTIVFAVIDEPTLSKLKDGFQKGA